MSSKSIFITGASSGIGAATVAAAAEAGWRVGAMARSEEKLQALSDRYGESVLPLPGDVTDPEQQVSAIAAVVETFGGLDAAFANAGLGASAMGTEQADLDNVRQMIDVNIWGAVLTARLVLPHLHKTKGHFLVTGSRAGRAMLKGSIYGGTKWFIHGWANNLHEEMREWGGRCTIISPGMVDTPFFDEEKPQGLKAEDIARAVLYALDQPATVSIGEIHLMPNPEGA